MLSGRELALEQNPSAIGFTNQRIIYTHGIGAAMVPVNEVANEGQPHLFIGNLPPVSTGGRPDHHRAADLLRRARQRLRRHRRPAERVRLPDRRGRRRRRGRHRDALDGHDRDHAGHDPQRACCSRSASRTWTCSSATSSPADSQLLFHRIAGRPAPRVSPRSSSSTRTHTSSSTAAAGSSTSRTPTPSPTAFPNAQPFDPDALARHGPGRRRRSTTSATASRSRSTPTTARCTSTSPIRRPDRPRLCRRLPDAVRAARRDAGRPARPPARARGAVQRPDARLRAVSRDRPAQFFRTDDLWTVPDRADERADPAVRGVLRRSCGCPARTTRSSCCSSRWSRPAART